MNGKEWAVWATNKYGSLEAAKAVRRKAGENSTRNKGKQGGFAHIKSNDPERFKEVSAKGGKISKRGKAVDKEEV